MNSWIQKPKTINYSNEVLQVELWTWQRGRNWSALCNEWRPENRKCRREKLTNFVLNEQLRRGNRTLECSRNHRESVFLKYLFGSTFDQQVALGYLKWLDQFLGVLHNEHEHVVWPRPKTPLAVFNWGISQGNGNGSFNVNTSAASFMNKLIKNLNTREHDFSRYLRQRRRMLLRVRSERKPSF